MGDAVSSTPRRSDAAARRCAVSDTRRVRAAEDGGEGGADFFADAFDCWFFFKRKRKELLKLFWGDGETTSFQGSFQVQYVVEI